MNEVMRDTEVRKPARSVPRSAVNVLPHFEALVAEANRLGLTRASITDLAVHDRAFLEERDPVLPFVWLVREGGTDIVDAVWRDAAGHTAVDFARWVTELGTPTHVYFWDGTLLAALASWKDLE